ncbi:alpha-mannosidase [Candidatus Harpocratesius sp.]
MGSTRDRSFQKTGEVGRCSGSERLDPTQFSERDIDNQKSAQHWLDDQIHQPSFRKEMEDLFNQWELILKPESFSTYHIHMVSQSHIDMAWLWRFEQTRQKGIKTLEKVIFHAEKFPDQFKFAISSPQLLQWVKEDDPELFIKIKALQKKGIIELVGGSWVEPDCMMPSGESIVRQRFYGMKFFWEEFGTLPEVEWFLDSFGYNCGLPQLLVKSGAKYFWTSKLTWNKQTKFPFIYFNWKSPDGTSLLTANFGQNREIFDHWKNFQSGRYALSEEAPKLWDYSKDYSNFQNFINSSTSIVPVGLFWGAGDGGHGPSHWEVAQMQVLSQIAQERGIQWKWSEVQSFFSELKQYQSKLAIWQDELYLETHRGTFTVHSEVKRQNRRLVNLTLDIEKLATFVTLLNPKYEFPISLFEKIWKKILLNQFHDVLPGSCIPEVLDDTFKHGKQCDDNLKEILHQIVPFLPINIPLEFESSNLVLIFNPLNWSRKTRVFIPKDIISVPNKATKNDSSSLPYARLYYFRKDRLVSSICQPVSAEFDDNMHNNGEGWWTIIELEAHEFLISELRFESVQSPPLYITLHKSPRITNGKVTLEFDPTLGSLVSIKARKINRGENLIYGKRNLLLEGYLDKGSHEYPAWDLQKEYWKHPLNFDQSQNLKISILHQGPVFSTLKIQRTLANSEVIQTVSLFHDDPLIYCSWGANWQLPETLLKIGLYTNTQAIRVTSDQMYCALSASTLPKVPADIARFEKIMHRYVDVSTPDNQWGIAIINEAKYAFDVSAGRIRISMHRSPKYPRPSAESWVHFERKQRKYEGKGKPPKYSGLGPTSSRFAILPHIWGCLVNNKNEGSSYVPKIAEEFNHPPLLIKINPDKTKKSESIPENISLGFNIPSEINLKVVKPEQWNDDGGLVLRFAELTGFSQKNCIIQFPQHIGFKVDRIIEVDLLERPIEESSIKWDSSSMIITADFTPFEIKTLKVVLNTK